MLAQNLHARMIDSTSFNSLLLNESEPNAKENVAIGEDSHVDVVDEDRVKVACLFVAEKRVGHPHFARVGQR